MYALIFVIAIGLIYCININSDANEFVKNSKEYLIAIIFIFISLSCWLVDVFISLNYFRSIKTACFPRK